MCIRDSLQIVQAIKSKGLGLITAFGIFDRNQDKVIDFNDFHSTLIGTLNMKMHDQEIEVYYKHLKKPFNQENFEALFKPYLTNISSLEHQQNKKSGELSQINRILQTDSFQLQKSQVTQSLRLQCSNMFQKKLQTQTVQEIFSDMDRSGNGYVDLKEMMRYLKKNGIEANQEDIEQFLEKLDQDGDSKLQIEEFYDFIMERQASFTGYNQQKASTNIINIFKYQILDYMMQKRFGFQQMFQLLQGKNQSQNRLKVNDIQDFCNYQLHMQISQADINRVSLFGLA
eukprot:TRINITY_DN2360_c0_g1_i14.p1 TRINITY_DN2360_c0_g1~~TRINITY_DN2360_c0_g1_i14.p1  ORF type:complete len:285 (+),score=40.25 TRINITY_DN2360_c0_g1_i14:136-990(+)